MWTKVVGFVSNPWVIKALLVLAASGLIWFAVHSYNEGIRETERSNNLNAQLTQVIKDNQELNKKLDKLEVKNEEILAETGRKNDVVTQRHTEVTRYIQSPEARASNRDSSSVIKNTVRMLQDEE